MKRILSVALIGLLLFGSDFIIPASWPVIPLHAAVAFINALGVGDTTGVGTQASASFNSIGSSLIVVFQCNYAGGGGTNVADAPTDGGLNTYTGLTAQSTGAFGTSAKIWYKENPVTSATHVITITGASGAVFESAHILRFSGTKTSATAFDQQARATGLSAGPLTPTEDNEVVLFGSCFADNDAGITVTAISTGFTVASGQMADAANIWGAAMGYQIQTTATARTPTATLSSAETTTASVMASFKQQAASTAKHLGPFLGIGPF